MALLWVALFTLAGCNSEITTVPQGEQADGMMQVNLLVHTADYAVQTRANGSVKGVEACSCFASTRAATFWEWGSLSP